MIKLFLVFSLVWSQTEIKTKQPKTESAQASLLSLPVKTLNNTKAEGMDNLKGSVVLIDFWTSWCEPCRESLPKYNNLYSKYKSKGLKILAISADETPQEAQKFLSKLPLSFPVYFDEGKKLVEHFDIQAVPTVLVLDKNLKLVKSYRGYTTNSFKEIESSLIESLKSK